MRDTAGPIPQLLRARRYTVGLGNMRVRVLCGDGVGRYGVCGLRLAAGVSRQVGNFQVCHCGEGASESKCGGKNYTR